MRAFAAAVTFAFEFACLALVVGSTSCSSSREDVPEVALGFVRPAIIAGSKSSTDHDAVVLVAFEDARGQWEFTCTGTMIAPNLLVTARHCLSAIDDPNVACDAAGKQVSGSTIGKDLAASAFGIYRGPSLPIRGTSKAAARGKRIFHDGAKTLCGHDLAFLLLDGDVGERAFLPIRLDKPPAPGESLIAVGYGLSKSGTSASAREERAGIQVRFVGPFAGSANDPPVAPNDFLVGESFCLGDSGGPGLAEGSHAVIGIATRVGMAVSPPPGANAAAPCIDSSSSRVYAFYTQTAPAASVANAAFAASGHAPWLEGQRPPWDRNDDEGCALGKSARPSPNAVVVTMAGLAALMVVRRSTKRWRRDRSRD